MTSPQSHTERFHLEEVEFIPAELQQGILYYSARFKTASHLCPCGCASKVVTPMGRGFWRIRVVGGEPTLDPSVGSWALRCRSHYYIRRGLVVWARPFTEEQVRRVRERDRRDRER